MNLNKSTSLVAAAVLCALPFGCADDGAPELKDTNDADSGETETDTMLTTSTTDPSTSTSTTTTDGTTSDAVAPEILEIDIIANPLSVLSATIEVQPGRGVVGCRNAARRGVPSVRQRPHPQAVPEC